MQPFTVSTPGIGPVFSYLDPLISAGIQPAATDSNQIIALNEQYFPLIKQGTNGLKSFYSNVLVCNGTTSHDIHLWYKQFVQHASTCGIYVHPYFCFRAAAKSLIGCTCGFDTAAPLVQYDMPGHFQPCLQD